MGAPKATYATASWLFVRLLGLVYFVAFWSLAGQIPGLIGHDGILPASEYLANVGSWADAGGIGADRYRLVPTIFWFTASDTALQGAAYGGAALGVLVAFGIAPILILPVLWLLYLSLMAVSGDFLSYQWDALLLETGSLAILLAPAAWRARLRDAHDPPPVARLLLWWLLFRLMFGSGVVKLASGDPAWRNLTAMSFHYETQPLPTPLAWYAANLPLAVHRAETALVLAVELVVPWLIAGRARRAAAVVLIALQMLIALTGNYGYFNLLSVVLCVLLLDDEVLAVLRRTAAIPGATPAPRWRAWAAVAAAVVTLPVSAATMLGQIGIAVPGVAPLAAAVDPLRSINPYGLFAVMTTRRLEIEVEGSDDGTTWRVYDFRDKPGPPARRPLWVAPYQPRLDWQMWYAALGRYDEEIWFQRFSRRLLEGSRPVLALLRHDPFDGRPPRYVRATLYQYHFTDWSTGRRTGAWWTRERVGPYAPVASR
jgi:hypothetical protein